VKPESKKNKKKSSFAAAVEKPKPVFDSSELIVSLFISAVMKQGRCVC